MVGVRMDVLIPSMKKSLLHLYRSRSEHDRMTLNEWLDVCAEVWGRHRP